MQCFSTLFSAVREICSYPMAVVTEKNVRICPTHITTQLTQKPPTAFLFKVCFIYLCYVKLQVLCFCYISMLLCRDTFFVQMYSVKSLNMKQSMFRQVKLCSVYCVQVGMVRCNLNKMISSLCNSNLQVYLSRSQPYLCGSQRPLLQEVSICVISIDGHVQPCLCVFGRSGHVQPCSCQAA